jgi:hypothetical protein
MSSATNRPGIETIDSVMEVGVGSMFNPLGALRGATRCQKPQAASYIDTKRTPLPARVFKARKGSVTPLF